MAKCHDIIISLLERNGLDDTDGRMLCKYRCTDSEYSELQSALQISVKILRGHLPRSSVFEASAFCLYVSEWWRKNYEYGHWTYSDILASLGMDPEYNRVDLYDPIRLGLRFWKRSLLTVGEKNAYLITLTCEGGLPLKIIHREGYNYLQQYLKALLSEFSIYGRGEINPFELASRISSRLPKGLRQKPLFQLCGELIEQVWNLQRQIGDSLTPLEDLDRIVPGWRESFPLVVSDEAAKVLLNNLIKDAVKIARVQEIKISTILKKENDTYRLERKIQVPSYFDAPSLAAQLGIPVHLLPYNVQIYLCRQSAPRFLLALITRRTGGDDGKFAVEIPAGVSTTITDKEASEQLWLDVRSNNLSRELRGIKGSIGLSELPWVFSSKESNAEQWELIGEGGIKTRHQQVLVAIPADSKVISSADICEDLGNNALFGRQLFRVSGTVVFSDGINTSSISTKALEEECPQFILSGEFLSYGTFGSSVYKGFPNITSYLESGAVQSLSESQFQWKTQKGKDEWKTDMRGCCGPVSIRYVKQGETRFMTTIDLVPKAGKVAFIPSKTSRNGAIEITGMNASEYGCASHQSDVEITSTPLPDGIRFECASVSEPPATLDVFIRWQLGQELALRVPYPASGVRFINRDGSVLHTDDKIHMSRMSGVVVQVIELDPHVTFSIEATALSKKLSGVKLDNIKLTEVAPGRHELDLRLLQEGCNLLFSAVEDIDGLVRIGVTSSKFHAFPQKIYVSRYDLTIEPDRETGMVFIPEDEIESFKIDPQQIELRAFPLSDPGSEYEVLEQAGNGSWQFSKTDRSVGPWLITGWDGDWSRIRPLCWTVYDDAETLSFDPDDQSFDNAVRFIAPLDRKKACDTLLSDLALDPNHTDWKKVDACFSQLKQLPATTFDVIGRLARHPDAAATALLKSGEDSFDEVWTGLERLPFAWYLIPVKSWVKSSIIREKVLRETLAPLAESFGGNLDPVIEGAFKSFFNHVPIRIPGMQPLVELLKHQMFSVLIPNLQYLQMFTAKNAHKTLQVPILFPAEQDLLQMHADDTWPICTELSEEWWLYTQGKIPEELRSLWAVPPTGLVFRTSVLNAPVAAAFCAAFNIKLNKKMVFIIRKLREFDENWFDVAYGFALASSIGYRLRNNLEFTDER